MTLVVFAVSFSLLFGLVIGPPKSALKRQLPRRQPFDTFDQSNLLELHRDAASGRNRTWF